jgi:hypothetical protein
VFFGVRFACFLAMRSRMGSVPASGVCMVRSLLVMARSVVFGGFAMVLRGLGMMFGRFGVMFRSLLRHWISSSARMILPHLNSRLPLSVPSRLAKFRQNSVRRINSPVGWGPVPCISKGHALL